MAQHLEYHAHVRAVHAADLEVVEQLDAFLSERVDLVALADLLIREEYLITRDLSNNLKIFLRI